MEAGGLGDDGGVAGSLFDPPTDPLLDPLLGPPAQDLDLDEAVDALQRMQVVKSQADARTVQLIERIRNLTTDRLHARTPGSTTNHDTTVPGFRPVSDNLADHLAASEIACALRLPERTSRLLVDQAHLLTRHYTPTLTSLSRGDITWRHAVTIVEQCVGLPPHVAKTLEHALLPTAADTTVAKTAHRARILRATLHPDHHADRATAAVAHRRLDVTPDHDGMAWLSIYLPAEHATGIDNRITTLARALQTPDEKRNLAQLRVDVLTDLLTHTCSAGPPRQQSAASGLGGAGASGSSFGAGLGGADASGSSFGAGGFSNTGASGSSFDAGGFSSTGASGSSFGAGGFVGSGAPAGELGVPADVSEGWGSSLGYRGITAHVNVTVPVLTLLGVDDAPANLEGYGPIPAHIARRLAAHAPSFTRILTHPETGAILSLGRTSYVVPADLRNWLRIRDKTCRHPGCNRGAINSEIDHTTPWAHGGETSHTNLGHLCRYHHALKTAGHWHYTQPIPGTIVATSPAGRTYTTYPEAIPA
ncbi:hypothetical protein IWX75_001272 [Arthrobacter sp. CAN_A6]|uniref:DUF222 domain-containing protein n=1 Tax=Arthrobacter sp. CAN_A6 TaxID=2787721 RepID=UPI001A287D68